MKKTGLALLVSSLLTMQVFAEDVVSFQQLLNERNISAIQNIIEQEPDNGEAYYSASLYYSVGDAELGANKDAVKSYEYLKKAVDLNWPAAQLQYGFDMLNQGNAEGIAYIKVAAESQYLPALTLLGDLYFAGYQDRNGNDVVEPDINQSIEYLDQAVAKGNQEARYTLGHIYLSSDFGEKNINKALELFEDNIDYDNKIGHLPTLITLIDIYNEGKDVQTNRSKLSDYYYLASLQDYQPAYYTVGMIQRVGGKGERLDISKDLEAAFVNLHKAASIGYIDAMFKIGEMYFNGEGTEQSDMNAYIWMAIAEDLSGNKTNYSETVLELIPKRQRQIAIDNKNHYRQFFTMPKAESSVNSVSNIQVQ